MIKIYSKNGSFFGKIKEMASFIHSAYLVPDFFKYKYDQKQKK